MILFNFAHEDHDNCRVYYRGRPAQAGTLPAGGRPNYLYCIQNDGYSDKPRYVFYSCSRDGEPSHELRMPLATSFDKLVFPS